MERENSRFCESEKRSTCGLRWNFGKKKRRESGGEGGGQEAWGGSEEGDEECDEECGGWKQGERRMCRSL